MKVIEKNTGNTFNLDSGNYLASGGEADVYKLGGTVYKIYKDKKHTIPEKKIAELSVLLPNKKIITPRSVLTDTNNTAIGYTMDAVSGEVIGGLIPPIFKKRNSIQDKTIYDLVLQLRAIIDYCHKNNILLVDINQNNFLVSKKFDNVYAIDVDTYQTPSFSATALMQSVRDFHSQDFNEFTDWFSFAVLACSLITGSHPYRGTYEPLANKKLSAEELLFARMKANISIFRDDVKIANIINLNMPKSYKDWFINTFDKGIRTAPPTDFTDKMVMVHPKLNLSKGRIPIDIWKDNVLDAPYEITNDLIVFDNYSYYKGRKIAFGGYFAAKHNYLFNLINGRLFAYNLQNNQTYDCKTIADAVYKHGDDVFIKRDDGVYCVYPYESNTGVIFSETLNTRILPESSKVFSGFVFESMLGSAFVLVTNGEKSSYRIRVPELDNEKVLDGQMVGNVCVIKAVDHKGNDKQYIIKFNKNFDTYSLRVNQNNDINFAAHRNGLCMLVYDNGTLEMFASSSQADIKQVVDSGLDGGILYSDGSDFYLYRDNKIYKLVKK